MRRILIVLLLAGMTVAHYSTSFVFLSTMAVAVVGLSASKLVVGLFAPHARRRGDTLGFVARLRRSSAVRLNSRPVVFNWVLLLVAGILVVSWSFVDLRASPSFSQNLHQVLNAVTGRDSGDAKSEAVNYSVTSSGDNSSDARQLEAYRVVIEDAIGPDPVPAGYYPSSVIERYPTPPGPAVRSGPASPVGNVLSRVGISPYQLNSVLRNLIARLLQIFAVIAVVLVFLGWRRSGRNYGGAHVYRHRKHRVAGCECGAAGRVGELWPTSNVPAEPVCPCASCHYRRALRIASAWRQTS